MGAQVEDVFRNEMTRSIYEVVEAELGERMQQTLSDVVQLNRTTSRYTSSPLCYACSHVCM